jgi:hypothetical protein
VLRGSSPELIEDKGRGFTVHGSRFKVKEKREDRIFEFHGLSL